MISLTYKRSPAKLSEARDSKTELFSASDPSHGTGKWRLIPAMAMASVAAGADGLMIEVHPNPDHALSDGAQSLTLENFANLMPQLRGVAAAIGRTIGAQEPAISGG